MEYHMHQHPAQDYSYWYPTTDQVMGVYTTTSGDYMHSNMTVYDNSCMIPTSTPLDYQHTQVLLDPSLSPYTPSSPATSLSSSFSPQPEYEQYITPASSTSTSPRSLENVCPFQDCTSKGKFKRRTDLNRHIKTQHEADNNKIDCKHNWCGRTGAHGFSRLDHLREHLRQVHQEKIPSKRARRASDLTRSPIKKESKPRMATSAPRSIPQTFRR